MTAVLPALAAAAVGGVLVGARPVICTEQVEDWIDVARRCSCRCPTTPACRRCRARPASTACRLLDDASYQTAHDGERHLPAVHPEPYELRELDWHSGDVNAHDARWNFDLPPSLRVPDLQSPGVTEQMGGELCIRERWATDVDDNLNLCERK